MACTNWNRVTHILHDFCSKRQHLSFVNITFCLSDWNMRIMQCVLKSATRLCKNSDTLGNDWFTTTHTVRTLSGAFYVLQLRDLVCIFFTFEKQHSKLHIFSQDSLSAHRSSKQNFFKSANWITAVQCTLETSISTKISFWCSSYSLKMASFQSRKRVFVDYRIQVELR